MSGCAAEERLGSELLRHSKERQMTLFNTLGYALGCTAITLASLKKHLCPSPSIPRDFHLIGQGWAWPRLFFF